MANLKIVYLIMAMLLSSLFISAQDIVIPQHFANYSHLLPTPKRQLQPQKHLAFQPLLKVALYDHTDYKRHTKLDKVEYKPLLDVRNSLLNNQPVIDFAPFKNNLSNWSDPVQDNLALREATRNSTLGFSFTDNFQFCPF